MALFGGLFDKKQCAICGGEIGLLGNKKLEDGNMCKDCAAKLSYWFSDRKHTTVEEIKKQLEYRENNKAQLANFKFTKTYGDDWKVMVDEANRKFILARTSDIYDENPDIIDFDIVQGVEIDINETEREDKRKDQEGKYVSYNPQRYFYSYDFKVTVKVNHPYFDDVWLTLNNNDVELNPELSVPEIRKPNPYTNREYVEYENMANEIKAILTGTSVPNPTIVMANKRHFGLTDRNDPYTRTAVTGDMWKCTCGRINDGKFCKECGAPKPAAGPKFCPECGYKFPQDGTVPRFCPECGTPVK